MNAERHLEHQDLKHEKIRFRRHEITDLASLPSAEGVASVRQKPTFGRRCVRAVAGLAAMGVGVVLMAVLAIYAIGVSGIGSERLRLEAEKALERMAGVDIETSMGPARITFDGSELLALEVSDVMLKRSADGAPIADAGLMRFGFKFLPLLSGQVQLSSARLADARIMVAALPASADWAAKLRNDEGLIDPDRFSGAVFSAAGHALDATQSGSAGNIALENVEFVLPPGKAVSSVTVVEASMRSAGPERLALAGQLSIDGRAMTLDGTALRDAPTRRVTELKLSAAMPAAETDPGTDAATTGIRLGGVDFSLSGNEGISDPSRISIALTVGNSAVDLGKRGVVAGTVDLAGTLTRGTNKIQVDRARAAVGRSVFNFIGAIGPRPPSGTAGEIAAYRYDLISRNSTIAPIDSPEQPLNTYIRASGVFQPSNGVLRADELVLKNGPGEVLGTASVQLVAGKAPGVSAALSVRDMPVAQVKQLWPWFSAPKARDWVMQKLFGGQVSDGRLVMTVPPDTLGNGVPLSGDEIYGNFSVIGTRFDTAGLIPPVRDAVGTVSFRGNDVDVALQSGTVYLSGTRTVAASNGTLTIKNANIPPVIGALDIDVAGDAAAITELASYDPINAMRFVGRSPDEFSGEVSGNVKADIPLQRGIDTSTLKWLVSLSYKNLDIAKPVDGQMITDAQGTITVEPTQAVISANAKISGAPARIETIEPIGKNGPERSRILTLTLDDKVRNALLPGLSTLVKGPMTVKLDASGAGRHRFEADLTKAELNLPWVGWTKGSGIDAGVSFLMENQDGVTTLSNFNLSGKSFGIQGALVLQGGSLSEARLSNVKLNRDDDVAVLIKQNVRGLTVDVTGQSLDVRSLIKQFTAKTDTATSATSTGRVAITAEVDRLTGFHGERLSDVKLDYSGAGDRVNGLRVAATASSGAVINLSNTAEASGRNMRLQSSDAGAILRFLDIYEHMEGGKIALQLTGGVDGPMKGQVDARNFFVVNEPKLSSMVSSRPAAGTMSLNQAVKADIDTSRVQFERLYSQIEKGDGYLKLAQGVLRGPLIGSSFQGTLYDKRNNMDMTGTFMPAYGLNRLFGQIPVIGVILGNGRDGGLIGVTFKLEGKASSPQLQINPLSAIAPGIFRSIFEFQ